MTKIWVTMCAGENKKKQIYCNRCIGSHIVLLHMCMSHTRACLCNFAEAQIIDVVTGWPACRSWKWFSSTATLCMIYDLTFCKSKALRKWCIGACCCDNRFPKNNWGQARKKPTSSAWIIGWTLCAVRAWKPRPHEWSCSVFVQPRPWSSM